MFQRTIWPKTIGVVLRAVTGIVGTPTVPQPEVEIAVPDRERTAVVVVVRLAEREEIQFARGVRDVRVAGYLEPRDPTRQSRHRVIDVEEPARRIVRGKARPSKPPSLLVSTPVILRNGVPSSEPFL